jgi:hypothetical protein
MKGGHVNNVPAGRQDAPGRRSGKTYQQRREPIMTKKTTTVKGGRNSKAQVSDFERRARAVIDDDERYDYDIRHAAYVALGNVEYYRPGGQAEKDMGAAEAARGSSRAALELREVVEKAEAGKTVPTGAGDKVHEEAARAFLALMYADGVPGYVTDALTVILKETEAATGALLYRDGIPHAPGGYSHGTLARVFARHSPPLEFERKRDLAELLLAALAHPDIPADLYNSIGDALNSLTMARRGEASPNVHHIRWCLSSAAQEVGVG